MADAVNQNENADELIKLGFDRLAAGDFNYATECFERSTTFEGKCYEAYWGLILSERLCRYRDGRDLIEKGFCIDKDLNYTLALIHADETSKETLYNVAKKCAFACHLKVLSLLDENKRRAAKLRADSYAKSSFAEESIVEAHKTLLKEEAFTDFSNEVPDTLLFLLAKYSGDDQYDYKQHNSVLLALYTKYMDKLLDAII
ncbi:MAG: hypothetical protein J6112_00900, partial [Clostridia bacterium]|nr:hypothetical protein [Clostridia bacterium]